MQKVVDIAAQFLVYCGLAGSFQEAALPARTVNLIITNPPEALLETRDVVLAKVKEHWSEYITAPDIYQGDPEIALIALAQNKNTLRFVPQTLLHNKEFLIEAAKICPQILDLVPTELQTDPSLSKLIAEKYAQDKKAVLVSISQDPGAYHLASPPLQNDLEVVFATIDSSKAHLRKYWKNFSANIRKNPDVALHAIKADPEGALYYISDDLLKNYPAIAAPYLLLYPKAITLASEEVLENTDFLKEAIRLNLNVYPFLKERFDAESRVISDEVTLQYQAMLEAFKTLNIEFPYRFLNSKEILRQRYAVSSDETRNKLEKLLGYSYFKGVADDKRPRCVVCYPGISGGAAFSVKSIPGLHDGIDKLTRGYRVVYYEARDEDEFIEALIEPTIKASQQADLLLISGHGAREGRIELSEEHGEKSNLDLKDGEDLKVLGPVVKRCGVVILASCYAGFGKEGGPGIDNMAEFFHNIWPECTLYAPTDATNEWLELDGEGLLIKPHYFDAEAFVLPPQR